MSKDRDSNLVEWIERQADGEPIEAVVIGQLGWGDFGSDKIPQYESQKRNVVLSWSEAKPMLDYGFHNGYGSPNCNAITAWSKSWVIAISQYDGSTSPFRLPRNPADHKPKMPGG